MSVYRVVCVDGDDNGEDITEAEAYALRDLLDGRCSHCWGKGHRVLREVRPCVDCGRVTNHPVGACDRCRAAASRAASRAPRDLIRRRSA